MSNYTKDDLDIIIEDAIKLLKTRKPKGFTIRQLTFAEDIIRSKDLAILLKEKGLIYTIGDYIVLRPNISKKPLDINIANANHGIIRRNSWWLGWIVAPLITLFLARGCCTQDKLENQENLDIPTTTKSISTSQGDNKSLILDSNKNTIVLDSLE